MDRLVLLCSQITLWLVCLPTSAGGSSLAAQYCSVAPVVLHGVGCAPGSAHWGDGHPLENTVGFENAYISVRMESRGLDALSVGCCVVRLFL